MTKNDEKQAFDQWCLVELMGHVRVAGRVTEEPLFGSALMRVDVPDEKGETRFTRYFGGSAIYSVTPISKDVAVTLAQSVTHEPITPWELKTRQITAGDEKDRDYGDPTEPPF